MTLKLRLKGCIGVARRRRGKLQADGLACARALRQRRAWLSPRAGEHVWGLVRGNLLGSEAGEGGRVKPGSLRKTTDLILSALEISEGLKQGRDGIQLEFGELLSGDKTPGAALVVVLPGPSLMWGFREDQPPRGALVGTTHKRNAKIYKTALNKKVQKR